MIDTLPSPEDFSKLVPVARALYDQSNDIAWALLLPLFALSIAFAYTRDLGVQGAVVVRLKYLIITALLLVTFPTIAETLQIVGVEIAKSYDNLAGIDQILDAAGKRADSISFRLETILNLQSDLLIGMMVVLTFILLLFARLFLLVFQAFFWFLVIAVGPFLMLCALFDATSGITRWAFKTLVQLSCWPIFWAILSVFLKSIPFASAYMHETPLASVATLNLLIALALLSTPLMVSQITEGANLTVGDNLKKGLLKVVSMANPKSAVASTVIGALKGPSRFTNRKDPKLGGR